MEEKGPSDMMVPWTLARLHPGKAVQLTEDSNTILFPALQV